MSSESHSPIEGVGPPLWLTVSNAYIRIGAVEELLVYHVAAWPTDSGKPDRHDACTKRNSNIYSQCALFFKITGEGNER